jgi:preprotein translocase subunit SecG
MGFIKNKLFIFIILILLQSCSGGRIGNFFESSFKNIEETKIKEDVKNNLKNKIVIKSGGIAEKKQKY